MTLGSGIFWSTVLILTALAIYQISVRNRWMLVGKVVVSLIGVGVLTWGAFQGWERYQNRPHVVTELVDVRLGMSPVEVTLAKGEPKSKTEPSLDEEDEWGMEWEYGSTWIVFSGEQSDKMKVSIVCTRQEKLLNIGKYNSEADALDKLGTPSRESINEKGLAKIISYRQWNVAYEIEEGQVSGLCIAKSGAVGYKKEYESGINTQEE